jgi:hypothetical protein
MSKSELTAAQFISIYRLADECGIPLTWNLNAGVVSFHVPAVAVDFLSPDDTRRFEYQMHEHEIADFLLNGKDADYIITRVVYMASVDICERCDRYEQDTDFRQIDGDGDLACSRCFDDLVDAADYEREMFNMRRGVEI